MTNTARLLLLILTLASTASAEWNEKVLYSFQGHRDGQFAVGSIVFDSAGNLYGATTQGGARDCLPLADCGIVFQLARPAKEGDPWTETVLHIFKGAKHTDGDAPNGGLVIDGRGNLYGVTAYGGTGDCVLLGIKGGCGTVYELSPPAEKGGAWTEKIVYSFPTAKQGYVPNGDLVFDDAGNLYGPTQFGGGKGTTCDPDYYQYCGTVFKLSPPTTKGGKWTGNVLYSFEGGVDGAEPNGGLVLDGAGMVYGTTYYGGKETGDCNGGFEGTGCGTVFSLTPPTEKGRPWKESVLHQFQGGTDSGNPPASVTLQGNGYLYGITQGTIFRLAPPSTESIPWKQTILHRFNNEANDPGGGLIFGAGGDIYGTTQGGFSSYGTVFRMKPPNGQSDRWTFALIYGFLGEPNGANPAAKLTLDKHGNLYSTTLYGGTGKWCGVGHCGVVFEMFR